MSGGAANDEIIFQFSSLSEANKFGWLSLSAAAAAGGKASSLLRFPVAMVLFMAVDNSEYG